MKCSIIDKFTISFDHLTTPLQHIILDRVAVGVSCKIGRTDPAHFAESLGQRRIQTLINSMLIVDRSR